MAQTKVDKALLRWAVQELREMDELCRGQVPGYGQFTSSDMDKIHLLERLAK